MEQNLIELMNRNHEDLRSEVRDGFKTVNEKLDQSVSKEYCKTLRDSCNKKEEWNVKKITSIGSVVVAGIGAATTLVLAIAKLFGVA